MDKKLQVCLRQSGFHVNNNKMVQSRCVLLAKARLCG